MVAHDPGAAAHVSHFGVVVAGFIVLQIKGGVDEAEIGEQPLGGGADGQLEQVVVGVAGIVVDPFLDFENLDREDGGFPVAQTGLRGQQQVADHHAGFGGSVGAVVYGAERHLGAGPGVHGVQVVDKSLHSLVGAFVCFPIGLIRRVFVGRGDGFGGDFLEPVFPLVRRQHFRHLFAEFLRGSQIQLQGDFLHHPGAEGVRVLPAHAGPDLDKLA